LHYLPLNLPFHFLGFASNTRDAVSSVGSCAVLCIVGGEELLVGLAVNALGCVIELLSLDRVLKV